MGFPSCGGEKLKINDASGVVLATELRLRKATIHPGSSFVHSFSCLKQQDKLYM